jgi:hypothetical protein
MLQPRLWSKDIPPYLVDNATDMERVSPLWLGIGISGTLILILLVTETLLGKWGAILIAGEFDAFARVSSGPLRDLRIAIVHCLQAGYLPAAFFYVLQTSRRTVFVLKDSLDCTAEECETLAQSIRLKPRWLLLIGLIAFTLSIAGPYLVPPVPATPWDPTTWSSEVVWHRILGPVTQALPSSSFPYGCPTSQGSSAVLICSIFRR